MRPIIVVIFLWLTSSAAVHAAPPSAFGVSMGAPITQFTVTRKVSENVFYIKPPVPHQEFESYLVLATPTHGVCKIVASGITHKSDKYGSETRAAYQRIKVALEQKYGNSKSFDFIRSGSIWDGAHEWAASINQNERTLQDFWVADAGSKLPEGMAGIDLDVSSTSLTDLYLMLSYEFTNYRTCIASDAQRRNRGL